MHGSRTRSLREFQLFDEMLTEFRSKRFVNKSKYLNLDPLMLESWNDRSAYCARVWSCCVLSKPYGLRYTVTEDHRRRSEVWSRGPPACPGLCDGPQDASRVTYPLLQWVPQAIVLCGLAADPPWSVSVLSAVLWPVLPLDLHWHVVRS